MSVLSSSFLQEGKMKHEFYYNLAVVTCLASTFTMVALLISTPLLYSMTAINVDDFAIRSEKFKDTSNTIWKSMQFVVKSGFEGAIFFSRIPRSPWEKHVCKGCTPLSCPTGLPGSAGNPGDDGIPGMPGNTGVAGDDGFDVELDNDSDDTVCVICPSGPPGMRGLQGERGQPGFAGHPGMPGPPGELGFEGPEGDPGPSGPPGLPGPLGVPGPPGDQVIAGIGIKGPKGHPGSAGPKGPPGPKGKGSKNAGMPGKPGPLGPPGPLGRPGPLGEAGPYGPPGEPGTPSGYCASDCGVSHILAPTMVNKFTQTEVDASDDVNGYVRRQ